MDKLLLLTIKYHYFDDDGNEIPLTPEEAPKQIMKAFEQAEALQKEEERRNQ